MGGRGKKKFPEGAIRINFLHQARHEIVKNVQGHFGRVLAANLGQNMVGCGRKSQIRLGSDIKKQLCKGCGGILLAGISSSTKLSGHYAKEKSLKLTCYTCNTQKTVFLQPKPNNTK
eukprot:TRINITY_DN26184_c0_g1_i1.p1 TRINITY_DN26184_c0_g1~~TRINITY_DN26184_c0_g1_i1.p1  ORF type:complete len:117 (-),score=11.87 TRINITY_DN26184_c0_g1_i1:61-411(-)